VVSTGSYILSAALLAVLALSLGYSAVRLRRRLLPAWEGAPAHLVEAIVGIALLIWTSELLGVVNILYAGTLVASSVALSVGIAFASGFGRRPPGKRRLCLRLFYTYSNVDNANTIVREQDG